MKKINKYLGFIILAVLTGLLLTGCSGIPSIRTDYNIASMLAGSSLQLKTSSSKIVWSVSSTSDGTGSVANGTTIAQNGLLTASINEPALSLYVRATNKKDKFNILQVRIVTVTSVTVSPENQTVVAGRNVQFKANVTGNNNPDSAVTWKVSSNAAGTGTVTSGTSVNSSGVLTVAAKESNSTLYVIATSRIDPSKSGSTAATVVIPAITDISVSPVNQSVIAGRTLNFNASVTGTYEPDSTVTWKVSSNPAGTGAVSPGTSISSNGTLTVDTHETITTLFITATSTYDPSKSGSASVTVLVPTVTNVAVTPLNQTITAGSTLQFNATVTGTNSPNTSVTWKVDSTGTGVIAAGTNINTNGLLSVSAGETSNVLYITATSVQDPTKTMSVIVSILIPTVTGVSVSPTGQTVERGGRIQFNSAVTGTNNPSQNVTWRVSSNAAGTGAVTAGTSISADGLLTVSENETSSPLFIFAASAVNPFVAGNAFVNVNIPSATLPGVVIPTVTNVAVSPSAQSTLTNRTLQFSASVTGTNNPDNAVTWRVSSNAAGSGSVTAGTSINSSGTLTIAANESLSTLYVIAASVIDPSRTGIATVTVTNASSNVTVTDVIVSPAAQSTVTNRTLQFSATVTGSNNPSTAVTWKVSPNTAGTGSVTSGTSINSNGLLTISANETLTTLYVIATSVADSSKSGRATVTISASTSVPSVTSVSVSPSSRTMDRGTSSQFSASVTGANNPDTSVTWRVSSNAAGTSSATSGTSINSSGSLTVSANETLTTLYVIATSVADTSKSGSATVTVNIPAPTVTSVTVSPSSRTMERNTTYQFSASVSGTDNPATGVTWRVSSNAAGTGSVTSGTSISSSGSLTVSANETLTTLYVIATSAADTSKSGSATVTVNIPAPTVTSVTVSPSSRTMERNTTYQFSASVSGTDNPATGVTWRVSSNAAGTGSVNSGTSVSSSGSLTVSASETYTTLYIIATSTADTSKSGSAVVTVNIPATSTVTSIAISPTTQNMMRGNTQQFTAIVRGNNPIETVTWKVSSNAAGTGSVTSGTNINSSGILTISNNEVYTTLYVIATSTVDTSVSGSAIVSIYQLQ